MKELPRPIFLIDRNRTLADFERPDRDQSIKKWTQSKEFKDLADFIEQEGRELITDKPVVVSWLDTFPIKPTSLDGYLHITRPFELFKLSDEGEKVFLGSNLKTIKKICHNAGTSFFEPFTPEGGDKDSCGFLAICNLEQTSKRTQLVNSTDQDVFAQNIRTIAEEYGHAADYFSKRKIRIVDSKEGYTDEAIGKTYALLRTMQYFRQKGLAVDAVKNIVQRLIKTQTVDETYNCEWAKPNVKYPHLSLPILAYFFKNEGKTIDRYLADADFVKMPSSALFDEALNLVEAHMPPQAVLYKDLEFLVRASKTAHEKMQLTIKDLDEVEKELKTDGYSVSYRNFFRDEVANTPDADLSDIQQAYRELTIDAYKSFCKNSLEGAHNAYTELVRSARRAALADNSTHTRK